MTNAKTHNSFNGKIVQGYKKNFRDKIKLGTRVEAVKGRNRLGNYFGCEVIRVREDPISSDNGLFAEKNVALKLVVTLGGVLYPKSYSYDLRYDDGSVDENVSPELIRPVVQMV